MKRIEGELPGELLSLVIDLAKQYHEKTGFWPRVPFQNPWLNPELSLWQKIEPNGDATYIVKHLPEQPTITLRSDLDFVLIRFRDGSTAGFFGNGQSFRPGDVE